MNQKFNSGGRPPKINATTFRCSVNFTATEQAQLMTMQEKSGIASLSAFIKMRVFGTPFKVLAIDENTRVFIDKLSALNAQYRTFVIDYDRFVEMLRQHFTEKKALALLYKLEQTAIQMVKVNREIVALARQFDDQWHKDRYDNLQI